MKMTPVRVVQANLPGQAPQIAKHKKPEINTIADLVVLSSVILVRKTEFLYQHLVSVPAPEFAIDAIMILMAFLPDSG